ncbi:PREDICTED: core-binding factor subunit beta [Nipponia nippon]|uniref:core-binding factor subunit beta n=1 Tax=Nipponia nippon TaxID=128390 RepID=UPI0005119235|nr:PREDICTED: core-binding factor subunit beta [Nipponia nippon]
MPRISDVTDEVQGDASSGGATAAMAVPRDADEELLRQPGPGSLPNALHPLKAGYYPHYCRQEPVADATLPGDVEPDQRQDRHPTREMLASPDGQPSAMLRAFVATGTNLSLQFFPASWQGEQRQTPTREYVDFEREGGKVYLKAPMILNGVCVIWKGWIDLQRLDGMGCLEFDEERAQQEDALAQQAFEEARRRTREFEDRDRSHREEMEARRQQDPSPGSNLGSGDDLKLR